jgi:general secretion pathway protein D
MTGRGAGTDWRRRPPSPWRYCALAALAFPALCWPATGGEPSELPPAVQTTADAGLSGSNTERPDTSQGLIVPEPGSDTPATASPLLSPLPDEEGTKNPRQSSLREGERTDLATALSRRGDLTLRNSTLDGALFTIGELWGINIVVGEVKGAVNGVFKDAPLREILDSILLSNGYSYRAVGESLVVSPLEELGQINPFFESATIPVHTADVDEVVEGARLLSTPQGQVRAIKSARSIFVLDFPDRVQMIRQFAASIDGASRGGPASRTGSAQPLEVGYFHTQYIEAKAAGDALQAVLSKDGRVGVMEKEDRLVVSDFAENLKMVEQVLKRIDRPRPQVRICALIYDLSLQDVENLGFKWDALAQAPSPEPENPDANSLLRVDSVFLSRGGTGKPFTFMSLSPKCDITAVIEALQSAKDGRLLADPHVAVLDNEEAEFRSVQEIPYQQLTQTGTGPPIGTTAFKNAGISLRVRPKIAVDGTIRMDVTPEYSRLTGYTPGDNQPIIDSRIASTTLTVANRQIVVIGGLRERRDVGDFQAIPYLKDIRWAGKLFRSRNTDVRESELVVFIMPEIIDYSDTPNGRQQQIVDTIDYRLNKIPQAEGRPPACDGPGGCASPVIQQGMPNEDVGPIPDPMGPASSVSANPQTQALVAQGRLRRLPSVDGNGPLPPLVVASQPAEMFGSPLPLVEDWREGSPAAPSSSLRPEYDARFQDASGVRAERVAERVPPTQSQPANEDETCWDRLRRF